MFITLHASLGMRTNVVLFNIVLFNVILRFYYVELYISKEFQ